MASKIGRRKLAGTSGLKTPEDVFTRMDRPFIDTSDTRSEEEELARWQSGQAGCAAANAAKSTGGDGWPSLAAAAGTGDPEGTFTPIDPVTAAPGPQAMEAGLESVSATMFDSPVIWRITGANSARKERWRYWRAEIGSDRLCRAPTRGL
jgi:hypothetical protein